MAPDRGTAMAMDFFEHQDVARRSTSRLVLYFVAAVVAIVVMAYLVVAGVVVATDNNPEVPRSLWDLDLLVTVGLGSLAVVGLGSMYKIQQLSSGGKAVAEMLGGRPLTIETADQAGKRLLNVVEEMAIASGTPVPPVYLLENEGGINAFAAGFTPDDAVIGVTRGALDHFDRDQLQGVVAHEFSHILNGDMRLNIRLMGILHGILVIALLGRLALRSMHFAGRSRNGKGGGGAAAVAAIGFGLIVVGSAGLFFGNLIKAAVSRQREFLADASAVQFTRNPEGIGGALKTIGGHAFGSVIEHRNAAEASHMFFGKGVKPFLGSIFATHPPLEERIRRIDPHWDGEFPEIKRQLRDLTGTGQAAKLAAAAAQARRPKGGALGDPRDVLATPLLAAATALVGRPTPTHLLYARELLADLPTDVAMAARSSYGARAVVYALLLHFDADVRARQLQQLQRHADPAVVQHVEQLSPAVDGLAARLRLPLLDMALPHLAQLTEPQAEVFATNVDALVQADDHVELYEWVLQRLLRKYLAAHDRAAPPPVRYYAIGRPLQPAVQTLLSTLAWAGNPDEPAAARAFLAAAGEFDQIELRLEPWVDGQHEALGRALDQLATLDGGGKRTLLRACALSISADGEVTVDEAELLRAVAEAFGVPLPPVLPGQPLV